MRLRTAALALLLPLAACGSPDALTQSAVEILRAAGTKTVETGSARMEMRSEGSGFSMTGSGVSALREVKGVMTMTISAAGQSTEMETRLLGDVMYLRMPGAPGGKPWVKFDLDELSTMSGIDLAALSQARQNDPTQALSYFAGVSDDVREDGEEEVRGEKTTRYKATFDLTKARDTEAKAEAKANIDKLIQTLGTSTMPATVWIDDAGRMRKMTYELDLSKAPQGLGGGGVMTTTFEMYDFGVEVDVAPPPANETADGADLIRQQQGG
ncbi:MAG TPA: hypothetical protein VNQ77_17375 [Frankiaceae bacterium]|nr:hypothetical protein [Frankiaceae bacterium]